MKARSLLGFKLLAFALVACVETREPLMGTQSLRIDLISPAQGSIESRLPDTMRTVVADATALDPAGDIDTSYNNTVQVYVNYLGTLTPYLGGPPLATITLTAGRAMSQTVMLPPVFGPTTLWFDDGSSTNPTY